MKQSPQVRSSPSSAPNTLLGMSNRRGGGSGGEISNGPSSLKNLVAKKGINNSNNPIASSSPYATEHTTSQMQNFEDLERQLTSLMTEKTSLEEELGR